MRKAILLIAAMVLSAGATAFGKATTVATTAPTTTAATTQVSSAAPTTFPTPGELIEKMRGMKKAKAALPKVAYLDLDKPVVEKPSDFSLFGDPDFTTLRSIVDRLRQAKQDKDVRAVLITIGAESELSFAQAQEIRDALADCGRAGKKTFVYADSYDTPAYTIASGANHICMLEGGEIMIPGVGMEAMFAKGLLDKVGVKADYVQIGEYKGADEQYTRSSASEQLKGEMHKLADSLYQQIVDGISINRNLSKEDVGAMVDDAMVNAQVALDRGLVDHLIDQDGLRPLITKELNVKEIDLLHDYGKPKHEDMDFSNPLSFFAAMSKKPEPSGKPEVALVYLDGVITDGGGGSGLFGGKQAGADDLRKALRTAARDENVKAVVLRINSPGGSALASEVIWQSARRLSEKKPLIISIGGMAASGGYYVASAGDKIYADPSAIVGSIGVVGGKFVMADLFDKLGLATETFSKGKNADLFSNSHSWDERQRKMITTWMKQTYDQFLERVMTKREGKIKHIDDVARGRIFAAKQGKDLGLVDEIGGLQVALASAAGKVNLHEGTYDIRILPEPKTLADYLGMGGMNESFPFQPKVTISPESVVRILPRPARRMLEQQLESFQLLQEHPVLLVSPVMVQIR
jgi:protease-4